MKVADAEVLTCLPRVFFYDVNPNYMYVRIMQRKMLVCFAQLALDVGAKKYCSVLIS